MTKEEFYAGGNSDPRNPNILKMFGLVNVSERAGNGVDKIMTAWQNRTGARKLINKMINVDLLEKTGEGNNTVYKIKE